MRDLIIFVVLMIPVCVAAVLWCTTDCALAEVVTYTFMALVGDHWFATRPNGIKYLGFCAILAGLAGLLYVLFR